MQLGLIGRSLQHSFSKEYFTRKFSKMAGHYTYSNFELEDISAFPQLLEQHPKLKGLNVTIPYKEKIIPFLSSMAPEAIEVGAVNTITIGNGETRGYNTDTYGFEKSLQPRLKPYHKKALILGSGGASKAVAYILKKLEIEFLKVSRAPVSGQIGYDEAGSLLSEHLLVINTTPLGTYPNTENTPPLDISSLTNKHLCYDLIYNPPQTLFLRQAAQMGAQTINGREMLELQAEKAWDIWNEF
ncbi:MAG: shikimate dehydrogenase family protein [Owenweeksia sp.]